MTQPLVTAIIPTYRRPALVGRSCRSVLAQTWRPLELIVVDDGSADETPQVLSALRPEAEAAGVDLRVMTVPNGGPGLARNAALQAAQGEYFAFLDDDDLWVPGKVQAQAAAMRANPQAGVSFTRYVHEGKVDDPKPRLDQMLDGWVFPHVCSGKTRAHLQTLMVTRAAWSRVGGFAPLYNFEDTEFVLRLALEFPFVAVREALTVICTPGQATISRQSGLEGDLKRDRLKLEVLDRFAVTHRAAARFSDDALKVLRARVYDEHVKHLLWLGRVSEARDAWKQALSECGDQPMLDRLGRKLTRARVASWFGLRLRKP